MSDLLNRRTLMLAGLASLALPLPAFAASLSASKSLVDRLVAEINQVIASGVTGQQMYSRFERIFDQYADVPTIALYCLGPAARSASQAQRQAFIREFRVYISRKYGARFEDFIGGRVEVNDARAVNNHVEVITTAYLRGRDPFRVDFHVSDQSGSLRFFNLQIEGVNMLATERTEIGSMLDRRGGNIDALISDLV